MNAKYCAWQCRWYRMHQMLLSWLSSKASCPPVSRGSVLLSENFGLLLFQAMTRNFRQFLGNISLYLKKKKIKPLRSSVASDFVFLKAFWTFQSSKCLIYFVVQMPAQADYFWDLFSCPRSLSFALDLQEHLGFHYGVPLGVYRLPFSCKESKYPKVLELIYRKRANFFLYRFYRCREMNSPWHNSRTKIDCFCNTLYNRLEFISLFPQRFFDKWNFI